MCWFYFQVVAEYAKDNLFPMILSDIGSESANTEHQKQVLHKQILEVDNRVLQIVKQSSDISGESR